MLISRKKYAHFEKRTDFFWGFFCSVRNEYEGNFRGKRQLVELEEEGSFTFELVSSNVQNSMKDMLTHV